MSMTNKATAEQTHVNAVLYAIRRDRRLKRISRSEALEAVHELKDRWTDEELCRRWERDNNFEPGKVVPYRLWATGDYDAESDIEAAIKEFAPRAKKRIKKRIKSWYTTGQKGKAIGVMEFLQQRGKSVEVVYLPDGERHKGHRYAVVNKKEN